MCAALAHSPTWFKVHFAFVNLQYHFTTRRRHTAVNSEVLLSLIKLSSYIKTSLISFEPDGFGTWRIWNLGRIVFWNFGQRAGGGQSKSSPKSGQCEIHNPHASLMDMSVSPKIAATRGKLKRDN